MGVSAMDGATADALFAAIARDARADVAALLRNQPALAQASQADGITPLHATALGGQVELAGILLAHDADANARDEQGRTPLHHASERGHLESARVLFAHGADARAIDGRGRPPLYLAAQEVRLRKMRPSPDVVALLLDHGAPLDVFAAAVLGRTDLIDTLAAADPSLVHARDAGGYTPLHLAAWNGKADTAALLLDAGADADALNERGETPLALAVIYENEHGMAEVIDLLLERGSHADIFTAVRLPLPDTVARLLRENPGLARTANRYGRTPAQYAIDKGLRIPMGTRWGNLWDAVEMLIAHGADVDLTIWVAAALGRREQVAALLHADPRLANASGASALTPLHWAAYRGHPDTVDLLLAYGADDGATDPYLGKTPLQWAQDAGHHPVVARLQQCGTRR